MTELVAFLSTGKGSWGHVNTLLTGLNGEKWNKIFLLTNEFGMKNFPARDDVELIQLNIETSIADLTEEIQSKLKAKIKGMEIGVNFFSGEGKEHMALVSALMKMGLGFRLISIDNSKTVVEL
ncbi:hypothetical protein HN992_00350 [Candidatus Woesearchaeota archaeon]|jgi:hypothetical protein|nr:hypothetical protein [Candidatus Woesearchaeota archaeon]MBT3438564.1 hypothetical protein [Candidatus Woesearchaeota archaeon]MBT4058314.1 hypothetical protein [Candidatus Woesearchaeota archaeon]MBT4208037.1 hypothetical protein [Candidatus Woesearchaeota archaeon]MBT4732017.1 hypothetical protein [Candidatus Woesearchaeota archaeon]